MSQLIRQSVLILLCSISTSILAESDYELGKSFWRQAKYREAYTYLLKYRDTSLYGRNAQVDYMLGTSGCRLSDLRVWGGNVLDWILRRYALTDQSRKIVQQQLAECRSKQTIVPVDNATIFYIENIMGTIDQASGKTFYWSGANEAINFYPAQRIREIPQAELQGRLVELGKSIEALKAVKARIPHYFEAHIYDKFIIAAKFGDNAKTLDKTAYALKHYINFLESGYRIELPRYYITIYMLENYETLKRLADTLHGLKISQATLGYSFRDDLSVLVYEPGGSFGTLMHEFFHLAVRSRFGDIPQWLDEGIASLYEVSYFDGDKVVGTPNWRGKILKQLERERPTIGQLVTSDWFAFEQPEMARWHDNAYTNAPSAKAMAVSLATARYFCLYLQEQGKLRAIYQLLRDQQPSQLENQDISSRTISIIERTLGKDIESVDRDFISWFRKINS